MNSLLLAEASGKSNNTAVVIVVLVLLAAAGGSAVVVLRRKQARRESAHDAVGVDKPVPVVQAGNTTPAQVLAPSSETQTPPAPPEPTLPIKMSIFLSYRREDSADVAGRIYDRLALAFGQDQVFKDVDSIPLGVDFRDHLLHVVGRCDVLLAVIGDHWLGAGTASDVSRLDDPKDFVRIELEGALQRGIPVIPVLVRGAAVPREADLPLALGALAYRSGIAVRADPDFHRDLDRLIEGVRHHVTNE
ncbi:MAG: toll/interleukin-1 receptor domain-containing protein [Ilumatobacteraceae bacterium]